LKEDKPSKDEKLSKAEEPSKVEKPSKEEKTSKENQASKKEKQLKEEKTSKKDKKAKRNKQGNKNGAENLNKQEKRTKVELKIISTVLFIIAAAGIVIFASLYFMGRNTAKNMGVYADLLAKKYENNISQNDWTLESPVGVANNQPGISYAIKAPDNDSSIASLIIYMERENHITSASIKTRNGKKTGDEQLLLMSYLVAAMYEELSFEQVGNLLSQMLDNDGMLRYKGYIWILRVNNEGNTFILMDESTAPQMQSVITGDPYLNTGSYIANENGSDIDSNNQNENNKANKKQSSPADDNADKTEKGETKTREEIEKDIVLKDLVNFIGKPFEDFEKEYGESEILSDDNIRCFKNVNVSCIYDEDTNNITYIDVDGIGEKNVTLCGLYIGMQEEDLRGHMIKQGIEEEPEVDEEGKLIYKFGFAGNKLKLGVTINNGETVLLAVSMQE